MAEESAAARVELAPGVWAASSSLRMKFSRGGGPGGQNVNKVNTRVELWVGLCDLEGLSESARERLRKLAGSRLSDDGQIRIVAASDRSQWSNRMAALDSLRALVRRALVEPRPRRPTRPTAASRQRRLTGKRIRSQIKAQRRGDSGE